MDIKDLSVLNRKCESVDETVRRLTVEAWWLFDLPEDDLYHRFQDDDFIRPQWTCYL